MSGHLIGCVKKISGVGKSHKLALVAFADSADDRTHIGFPGYEGVQEWADCSRGRAAELIAGLVEAGYLAPHRRARPGKRAEYVVFPNGCCELHKPVGDPDDGTIQPSLEQVLDDLRAAGVDVTDHIAATLAARYQPATENGSGNPDLSGGDGSGISDPSDDTPENGSEISDSMGQRVQNGSEISDAYTTTTTTPPTPRTAGGAVAEVASQAPASGRACARHTTTPGTNCRACGTTARQIAEREQQAQAAAERAAAEEAAAVERRLAEQRRASRPTRGTIRRHLQEVGLR